MSRTKSPFYPPRAGWRHWVRPIGYWTRRRLELETLRSALGISLGTLLLSLVIPGFALAAFGRKFLARCFFAVYLTLGLLAAVFLGEFAAAISFGFMIGLHGISLTFLAGQLQPGFGFGKRMLGSCLAVLILSQVIYRPLLGLFETNLVRPVRCKGQILLIDPKIRAESIHRGDWIAYELPSLRLPGIYSGGGLAVGEVLAVGGDRIRLSSKSVEVNQITYPRRPHMPAIGGWIIPEKQWFIWPELDISNAGNASHAQLAAALEQLALVNQSQLVGAPYQRWFGRRQHLP